MFNKEADRTLSYLPFNMETIKHALNSVTENSINIGVNLKKKKHSIVSLMSKAKKLMQRDIHTYSLISK